VAIAQNPDIASKIGVAPPVGNKATLSPAIFVANGITRDSKNPEAAWKFIQYLSGLDANIEYARVSGFQSMRNDVDPTTVSSDPFMMSFAQYLKDYGLMIPQYPHKTDIDLIVATALQEIMLDIKPTKRALDDAAERINQLLQTAY
jgi:multiple sugar transport system substrate-binding protein